jgi:antitoxin component of MazEF toxin-antitoxin module
MVKTLVKHGNSYALVIDKPILELLNISPETPLEVSTSDGKTLTIKPAAIGSEARARALQTSLASINMRYRRTLERLAK